MWKQVSRVLVGGHSSAYSRVLGSTRTFNTVASYQKLPVWIFMGPPGVGKGTFSQRIAEWLSVPHVSAGDLVRAEIARDTPLGRDMARTVNSGNILPTSIIFQLLQDRFIEAAVAGDKGVVLDGFPRSVEQAQQLTSLANVHLAINVQNSDEQLIQRCLGRRHCTKCGLTYNLGVDASQPGSQVPNELRPPPACSSYLKQRADDKLDVVRRRLEVYRADARPLEDYYRNQGILVDVVNFGNLSENVSKLVRQLESRVSNQSSCDDGKSTYSNEFNTQFRPTTVQKCMRH